MGDVKLSAGALRLPKEDVPELGGREFGLARTKTGNFAIVPLGSDIYRVAAIEWDQDAIEQHAPMDLGELQAAIRRVMNVDLPMSDAVWLSRPADSSRLVERYPDGRVFLAGDAAHVHWAYGGKGTRECKPASTSDAPGTWHYNGRPGARLLCEFGWSYLLIDSQSLHRSRTACFQLR
jgi:FAD binding domain